MSNSILIWGAGAIGGVVAARLVQAGHDVVVVDIAQDHIDAIRSHGLEIIDTEGESDFVSLRASTPAELTGRYDRIMLAVKGQHTTTACAALLPHLTENGWVLALQNCLTEPTIAQIVGDARTMGALVNFASDYVGPGRIQFGGLGSLQVGECDGRDSTRSREAASLMQCVDPTAAWTDQLMGLKWSKVALGSMLFATALSNETVVDQLSNTTYAPLWRELGVEVVEVARAVGIAPAPFAGFDAHAFSRTTPAQRSAKQVQIMADHCRQWTAKPRTGIWRDLAVRKRKTEVDPQITDVLAYGLRHGIATPVVARLVTMVQEMEQGTRTFDIGNLDELMEVIV